MPAPRAHRIEVVVAVLVALTTFAPRARPVHADEGLAATGRVPSAAPGPALALALGADYGYSGALLESDDGHHRVGGDLALAYRPRPGLEVGLHFRGRYDRHTGGEADTGLVGEPRLWLQAGRRVATGTWLAARLGVWLPGADAPSIDLAATTVDLVGVATWRPSATRVSAMLGYRLDRSALAVDAASLSDPDRIGLGWSDADAVLVGVEVAHRVGRWQPRLEVSGELRIGQTADGAEFKMVGLATSPLRLELGVRRDLDRSWRAEAAVDVAASQRPRLAEFSDDLLITIEPRVTATVGLSWRQAAPVARTPTVVVEPPPPEVIEPPPPPPPATGSLRGRVVDDDGAPLPGAVVRVGDRTATTGDDGGYRLDGLPPGDVELAIERVGHAPLRRTATVVAGAEAAAPDLTLTRIRPPSQIRGVIRSFDGRGLGAAVRIEPLGLAAVAGSDGQFSVDVPPGTYQVVVTMVGFKSQTRQLTVEVEGVAIVNIELQKARP